MSLVYEALQKAAREKQRKTGESLRTEPTPIPSKEGSPTVAAPLLGGAGGGLRGTTNSQPAVPAPAKSHQGALVVVAASVALVAIVAIVLMVFRQTPTKVEEVVRPVIPQVAKPQPVMPVTPVAPVSEPLLKLTGIAPLPDGGFCAFFAGQPLPVYEEQPIEGATVKKIEKDRVTLVINGREVVLRLF